MFQTFFFIAVTTIHKQLDRIEVRSNNEKVENMNWFVIGCLVRIIETHSEGGRGRVTNKLSSFPHQLIRPST